VASEFDGDAAQNEQPENHHQRQIKSAEAGSVQNWKCEKEDAATGKQPHFVGVPHGADGAEDAAALGVVARNTEMNDAGAEIESVEENVNGEHDGDEAEPERRHINPPLRWNLRRAMNPDRQANPDRDQFHDTREVEIKYSAQCTFRKNR
jgi:hypothetical protein